VALSRGITTRYADLDHPAQHRRSDVSDFPGESPVDAPRRVFLVIRLSLKSKLFEIYVPLFACCSASAVVVLLIMSKTSTHSRVLGSEYRVIGHRRNDRSREKTIYRNDDKGAPVLSAHFGRHGTGTCHPSSQDQVTSTPPYTLPHAASRPDQASPLQHVSQVYIKQASPRKPGPSLALDLLRLLTATHSTIVHPTIRVAFFQPPPQ